MTDIPCPWCGKEYSDMDDATGCRSPIVLSAGVGDWYCQFAHAQKSEAPQEPVKASIYQYSGVSQSGTCWCASHRGKQITFSSHKYGAGAKELAAWAYAQLLQGVVPDRREIALARHPYSFALVSKELGISLSELRQWIITGQIQGLNVLPPCRVSGREYIAGYELAKAKQRLIAARHESQESPAELSAVEQLQGLFPGLQLPTT